MHELTSMAKQHDHALRERNRWEAELEKIRQQILREVDGSDQDPEVEAECEEERSHPLINFRTHHQLTQAQAARRLGIPAPTLAAWEAEGCAPSERSLGKIQRKHPALARRLKKHYGFTVQNGH